MWPFRKRRKSPEAVYQPEVVFEGEQDGPIERELKSLLVPLFRADGRVLRAYLCRVGYPRSSEQSVALCLACEQAPDLAAQIGEVFASKFRADVALDIMFLDSRTEPGVAEACPAFYDAG